MTLSQLALEDVEALCFEPSFLMADPMGPPLDQDEEEEALSPSSSSLEGKAPASPPLSYSSYASSLSPYQTLSSSPPHPSSFLGTKAEPDPLSWLDAGSLLHAHVGAEESKADDAFAGMDWMTEKMDLSEFDLDSLIGSCSSDDPPSSPEELLASLDSQMDRDPDSYDSGVPTSSPEGLELGLALPDLPALPLEFAVPVEPEAQTAELALDRELVMKLEPLSPPPASPMVLEIQSDVDLLDKVATTVTATIIQDPASGRMLLVVTNKEEPAPGTPSGSPVKSPLPSGDSDGDSGIDSPASSPPRPPSPPPPSTPSCPAGSSRTKPYTKSEPTNASASKGAPKVKSVSGAPKVVEKKLKKMEQNKTAATRYRQKKRVEQELLSSECDELEKRNQELEEKAESISREIQYLKDLMEEVRKRRSKTGSTA